MPASSPDTAITTPHADLAACRAALSGGSRSFRAASRLLPPAVANSACQLYAFCRDADDLVDEGVDPGRALTLLGRRIDAVYGGAHLATATDRALADVVRRHCLPRELLDALIEGFAWDVAGRRYDSLSELIDYAVRVAGTVGVLMALLMGRRETHTLARAADLGIAMQLTNIARDVGEDARAGRLYLPLDWLREAGIDPDVLLADPHHSRALGAVIERLLREAQRLYARADSGIRALPLRCQPGIYAARLLYAGIGGQVARRNYDAVSDRAVVPARHKLSLLARVAGLPRLPATALFAPPQPEVRYLLDAVQQSSLENPGLPDKAGGNLGGFPRRMIWMLELVEVLQARDRSAMQDRIG